nr:hypothetical protein [Tanacetum cinerariifolium]
MLEKTCSQWELEVPSGYSANIKNLVSMKDLKLLGMKSHDCHVLLTQMISIAIRGLMPPQVRQTITKLCLFFNMIHSKVLDHEKLEELQRDIILILCQLEMYFLPSFFDVMVHLVSHIVEEIQIASPVFLRGVTLIATTTDSSRMEIAKDSYYSVIEEIWELDYTTVVIPILKCKWVDNTRSGVKVNNDGFMCVNLSTNGYLFDPFILAKQVDQVFYVEDPLDKRWHIVLQSKRSIVGVDDVVDEDEYNKFNELPPFSIGFQSDYVLSDAIYLRSDHQEGQED